MAQFVTTAPAVGDILVAGNIQSHSPDHRRVELSGVFLPGNADTGWWYYDWGDGTRSTGYFPTHHRYSEPGEYTIRIVGFNDLGENAETSIPYTVPVATTTDIAHVVPAATFLGLKETEQRSVLFTAYDAAGNQLPLDGRTVELYVRDSEWIDVTHDGNRIDVTALDAGSWDTRAASVYAYVDQVEVEQPLFVITNSNSGHFDAIEGARSAFYLPQQFFANSFVSPEDHALALDLAYEEFAWATRQNSDVDQDLPTQGVSYVPPVFGVSGNPLALGDAAAPFNGVPHFGVMFHEVGHNFQAKRMLFLSSGALSGPLYQETLAEWHVQFAINRILDGHADELSAPLAAALRTIRDDGRAYHAFEYQNYINGGMVFDFTTIMPSHVLVQKIYELCDIHGWERLRDFYDYFDISSMDKLSEVYGNFEGSSDVYRLSALIAVLGLTFGEDLRPAFVPLNFPIDDAFHDAVWQALTAIDGDFNEDGMVDAADYVVWRKNNGTQQEYDAWRANFGRVSAVDAARATTVPEPAIWPLALASALFSICIGRSRASNETRRRIFHTTYADYQVPRISAHGGRSIWLADNWHASVSRTLAKRSSSEELVASWRS